MCCPELPAEERKKIENHSKGWNSAIGLDIDTDFTHPLDADLQALDWFNLSFWFSIDLFGYQVHVSQPIENYIWTHAKNNLSSNEQIQILFILDIIIPTQKVKYTFKLHI